MSDYEKELDDLLEGVYHRGNTDGLNDEWNPDNLGDAKAKLSALLRRAEVEGFKAGMEFVESAVGDFDDNEFTLKGYDRLNQITARKFRELEAEL